MKPKLVAALSSINKIFVNGEGNAVLFSFLKTKMYDIYNMVTDKLLSIR